MAKRVWEHDPETNAWFVETAWGWANVTSHHGAFVTAFVQPKTSGCKTGSFHTSARAISWCEHILGNLELAKLIDRALT